MNALTLIVIIGVVIVIGFSLFKNAGLGSKVATVTPQQAQALIQEGAFVLDVRTPQEYASGHLKGAKLIPVADLGARLDELPAKDTTLLVYCHAGSRSMNACGMLARQEFTKLNNLGGGIQAWQREGLATERTN